MGPRVEWEGQKEGQEEILKSDRNILYDCGSGFTGVDTELCTLNECSISNINDISIKLILKQRKKR